MEKLIETFTSKTFLLCFIVHKNSVIQACSCSAVGFWRIIESVSCVYMCVFSELMSRTCARNMSGRWPSWTLSTTEKHRTCCRTSTRPRNCWRTRSKPCRSCEWMFVCNIQYVYFGWWKFGNFCFYWLFGDRFYETAKMLTKGHQTMMWTQRRWGQCFWRDTGRE